MMTVSDALMWISAHKALDGQSFQSAEALEAAFDLAYDGA